MPSTISLISLAFALVAVVLLVRMGVNSARARQRIDALMARICANQPVQAADFE